MKSRQPKVLHEVAGRPMLAWVLDTARAARCSRILVVVGHASEEVRAAFAGESDVTWVEQREQLGTGHALAQAEPLVGGEATLLVLSGDAPLVRPETLERMADAAAVGWGAMATAVLDEPGSLGRVTADAEGRLERIVEASDATPEEQRNRRVNSGIYALRAPDVFADLARLGTDNVKGEYYLTDAVVAAAKSGRAVALHDLEDPSEAFGINDRRDLAEVRRTLLARRIDELMLSGVTVLDPARTVVEAGAEVGADTVLHPGVTLLGRTRVGTGCVLHQGAWIRDSTLGEGVEVHPYTVLDGATLERGVQAGPFARLRPETVLGEGARVGNFVEVKKSRLGPGTKASHLAYVGDAEIGAHTNIGAGAVTCNYDGEKKHRTTIGDNAFVGSDTMLVAPVRVGHRATTAAGSTITLDVPDDALAVGRARQRNIEGWTKRKKRKG